MLQNLALSIGLEAFSAVAQFPWLSISRSHRPVEVDRDLWRSSGPSPCSSRAT